MKLSFVESTRTFVLRVPRGSPFTPKELREEHGLDFSTTLSTPEEAVLLTREPYAAASFWEFATEGAQMQLLEIQQRIGASWAISSGRHIDVPADKELSPFQIAGVDYIMSAGNALCGDQPGLGKTMQAIATANEMQAKRVLVVCPASIRIQWMERIRDWSTMRYPYTIYPILHGRHGVHPTAAWTIVSFDLARKEPIWQALAEGHYDLLIIDEAHYCKTVDAQRTRALFGRNDTLAQTAPFLASCAEKTLALTGTPLPNRPREAYVLARGLDWAAIDWVSEDKFSYRFNPSITMTDGDSTWVDERSGRHGELQSRMRANFMVRRMKRTVLPQLKLPLLDIVHVEETTAVKQALHAESLLDIDPESLEGVDAKTLGDVATVRRLMGLALAPAAADYAEMILNGGEPKLVVFAWHTEVLDFLEKKLARFHPLRIDGSTPTSRRPAIIRQFQGPSFRLLLGNMLALGIGTDGLQDVCQRGLAAEADWVPGTNEQCIDRLDRMGQEGQVQFDFLAARGSFAEKVLGSSLRKKQTTHKALDRRYTNDHADVNEWVV